MRYHPLYDGLWTDERLGSFETRAFFAFLFSNYRVRPSGLYRVTNLQLQVDTGLSLRRVAQHLERLERARRIVRDAPWVFVLGYLKRQPKSDRLLAGVQADIAECTSTVVLEAFGHKYQHLSRWSRDRLQTITRPSVTPLNQLHCYGASFVSTEQLQSSRTTEQSSRPSGDGLGPASALQGAPAPQPDVTRSTHPTDTAPGPLAGSIGEFMAVVRRAAASPLPDSLPRPGKREVEL